MPLPLGTKLGPHEILAPLGAGGMGEVYRARDTQLGRDVAIKVLPSFLPADSDRLRRFEQEARAAAAAALGRRLTLGDRVFPSPDPSIDAFPRLSSHRNIFRIKVQ